VCHECTRTTRRSLHDIIELVAYADDKRARFGSSWRTGTIGRSAGEQPLPYDPRVTAVLEACLRALRDVAIATAGSPERIRKSSDPRAVAAWLAVNIHVVRGAVGGGQRMQRMQDASDRVKSLFDRPPDRIYVGRCNSDGCTESLYAAQDHSASVVACPKCKHETPIQERRDQLAAGVEDYLGTVREISRLLRATLGDDVSERMIRSLADHGLIQTRGTRLEHDKLLRPRQVATYRIGDVRQGVHTMRTNRETERAVRRTVREEKTA
jgi:hypothetical protein